MQSFISKLMSCLFWLTLFGGSFYFIFYVLIPQYNRSSALERERAQVQLQIEERQREIAELKEKQRRFRDDRDFVESIARQNHLVFPGEVVFVYEK